MLQQGGLPKFRPHPCATSGIYWRQNFAVLITCLFSSSYRLASRYSLTAESLGYYQPKSKFYFAPLCCSQSCCTISHRKFTPCSPNGYLKAGCSHGKLPLCSRPARFSAAAETSRRMFVLNLSPLRSSLGIVFTRRSSKWGRTYRVLCLGRQAHPVSSL